MVRTPSGAQHQDNRVRKDADTPSQRLLGTLRVY